VQEQVRTLVGGEATGKSEREHGSVQAAAEPGSLVGRHAHRRSLLSDALARVVDEGLPRGAARRPQLGVRRARNVAL